MKVLSVKKFKNILLSAALLGCAFFIYWGGDDQAVLFQSQESKGLGDSPVLNQVRYFNLPQKEVWMMGQKHQGEEWQRLAIVVSDVAGKKTAQFFQLAPGPLEWQENLPKKEYRVSCFMCHPNGPRVIRPESHSTLAPLGVKERAKIFLWNLKIKSYGRVEAHPQHAQEAASIATPFRHSGKRSNEKLKVKTCLWCHQEEGWFKRGELTRQNALTIEWMVSTGQMPPLGMKLSAVEKKELERFLMGF